MTTDEAVAALKAARYIPKVHASESQHWYYPDGRPAYTVPSADGKRMITPDIRHARKLGLLPGVTGIIKCAAKPQLIDWLRRQTLMAALTLPRKDGEAEDAWIARIEQDADEQSRKAAERGTEIHAAIQGHYEGVYPSNEMTPFVRGAVRAVGEAFGYSSWKAEQPHASTLGFGCKIDLIGAAVIDFKTKDFKEAPTKENKLRLHWDEHAMQLAANREAAGRSDKLLAPCANVFVSTSVPGLCYVHIWDEDELVRAFRMFFNLLCYWKNKNRYYPPNDQ